VATYAYVNPVVAIVLGALILSEELTLVMLLAAGVIVASVAFVVTRQHERREPIVAGSAPAPAGRA